MGNAVDRERDHTDRRARVVGAVDAEPGDCAQPCERVAEQQALVIDDAVPADLAQRRRRRGEGDGPEQVGGSRLLPVGKVGPCDVVERDRVDGAAPTMVWRARERVSAPDNRAATERRVQLVRRQRHEVEVLGIVMGTHVDRPVRGQLGGVDEDSPACGMHPSSQFVDRRGDPGDVRCSRHDQHRDPTGMAVELTVEVVEIQPAVGRCTDVHRSDPSPPRKIVGVMLQHGGEHDVAVLDLHRPRQLVDRLGRVLREHDHVSFGIGTEEVADRSPCCFVRLGTESGLVAGATVNAAVDAAGSPRRQ